MEAHTIEDADRALDEATKPARQQKSWIVVRIVDYRLQALVRTGEQDAVWEDISKDTWITTDRDEAFQVGRGFRGLLLSANGLPSARQLAGFIETLGIMSKVSGAGFRSANTVADREPELDADPAISN